MSPSPQRQPRVAVVIVTRNRCQGLLRTLQRLDDLPEKPAVIVVDNNSADATVASVRAGFPGVQVIALNSNKGSFGRNVGVHQTQCPYIAFCDDDSWWAPGALAKAAELFESYPRLGLINARILVGPQERLDPTCAAMMHSPLPEDPEAPGKPILGFVACGAIIRRAAFDASGGFNAHFGIGGEENLLAMDLASQGWLLAYVPEIVACHHPSDRRENRQRRLSEIRNRLWSAWLRRPLASAWTRTTEALRHAGQDSALREGAWEAVCGLPWVLRSRRVIPRHIEEELRLLEAEELRLASDVRRATRDRVFTT